MWELVKLEIIQESYLKEFYTYENIAFPGLIVLATYIDGSTEYITDPHLVFTQTDVPGTYICYVYKNKRSSKIYTSFEYKVVEEPKVQARTDNSKINVAKICAACMDTSASVSIACVDCTASSSSSCSSTQQQCSSSVSTCTTTYTQCSSTVSQCTTTASACTTTASKCTGCSDVTSCGASLSICTTTASKCTGCSDVTSCGASLSICTSGVSVSCVVCSASLEIICTGCDDVTDCGASYGCTSAIEQCTSTASKCTSCDAVTDCGSTSGPCTSTVEQCTDSYSQCSTTQSQCTSTTSQCSTTQSQCTTNYNKYNCWSSFDLGCSCSSFQECYCTNTGISQCSSCPTSDSVKADVNMEVELEGMLTQVTNIKTATIKNESKKVGLEYFYSTNKGIDSSTAYSVFSSLNELTLAEGDEVKISYYILSASSDNLNISFIYDETNIGTFSHSGSQASWATDSVTIPSEYIGKPINKLKISCTYVKDLSGSAGADQAWVRNPVIHHKIDTDKYRDIYMDQKENIGDYYFEKMIYQP